MDEGYKEHDGPCKAIYVLGICEWCGADMFEEMGYWFHHTQKDIPYKDRTPQYSPRTYED